MAAKHPNIIHILNTKILLCKVSIIQFSLFYFKTLTVALRDDNRRLTSDKFDHDRFFTTLSQVKEFNEVWTSQVQPLTLFYEVLFFKFKISISFLEKSRISDHSNIKRACAFVICLRIMLA